MSDNISGLHIQCTFVPFSELSSENPEKSNLGSLVAKGQSIAKLSKVEGGKDSPAVHLVAGENSELSDDGCELLSRCYGYPMISISKKNDTSEVCIEVMPFVELSEDKMEARLNLYPPQSEQEEYLDIDTILQTLEQQGVLYGIDRSLLENELLNLKENNEPRLNCLIARGKAPIIGKDAFLRFEVEVGPLPGKILANGKIDFRERLMFVGVEKDQLIACKEPATRGKSGVNVAGELLEEDDGNDIAVKVSEDTHYCEEDGTIRATAAGVLSIVGGDTIRVSSIQKISGNVDYSTGNIRSHHSIEISGSVLPGFMISAKGNVSIQGSLQSAQVNCHGNVVIKGGITGRKSRIRVQGDVEIHHIEKGLLLAGGNIVIRTGSYYSTVQAGGDIHCPEKVKIMGGDVVAGGSLSCGQIGSPSSEPMNIAVGTDPHRYRRYEQLKLEYQDILNKTQDWYVRHGRVKKLPQTVKELEAQLQNLEQELSTLNLLANTPEDSLGDRMYSHTKATITVHSAITAGNVVRFGNEVMEIERDLEGCVIKMNPNNGKITVVPLK